MPVTTKDLSPEENKQDGRKFNGGARSGAGPKLKGDQKKETATFTIDANILAQMREHFKGALSQLIENYFKKLLKKNKKNI